MVAIAQLLRAALPRLKSVATAAPEVIARIGKRLNIASEALSPKAILEAAKNNKLATAYVLYELYGLGDSLLQQMMATDPAIKAAIQAMGGEIIHKNSKVSSDTLEELVENDDELEIISDAIGVVGSFEKLVKLRQAIGMPESTMRLYQHVTSRGRKLRAA